MGSRASEPADWRAELFARRVIGVRLGTASIERILDAMLPGLRERPPFEVVQIVGTNGKGSTSALLDHGLRSASAGPVGLFTSPHLEQIGERVRVDGQPLDDRSMRAGIARVARAEAAVGVSLSFFEVLTAIALATFADAGCRRVVLEAGLGGRLDATTVIRRSRIGVARIARDHEGYLGDTITAIAAEKAAVIDAGVSVFSVAQVPAARAVLDARAREQGAALEYVLPLAEAPGGLLGPHQRHNGALALALLRTFEPAATVACFDGVRWPGRLERIDLGVGQLGGGQLWLDVAHNLDGVEALVAAASTLELAPRVIVFGAMADKPAAAMAARLRAVAPLWLCPPARAGSFELDTIARPDETVHDDPRAPELLDALEALLSEGASVLVCGSHFLVGALRAWALGRGELDGPELSDPVARTRDGTL